MNVSPASIVPSAFQTQYAACRTRVADDLLIALLHVGADETILVTGSKAEAANVLSLPLGTQQIANKHFHHTLPTPEEMEDAIMTVEDVLAAARSAIPADAKLMSMDGALCEIAALAGLTGNGDVTLHRDAVEQTFDRLAGVVLGRPAASEGVPEDRDFAARLLILREFMHHLGFEQITLHAATRQCSNGMPPSKR